MKRSPDSKNSRSSGPKPSNTKIDFNKNEEESNSYDPYQKKKSFSAKIYADMEEKLEKNKDQLAQSSFQPKAKEKPKPKAPQEDVDFLN